MQTNIQSFDDIQERLLELGASTKKKTAAAVGKGYAGAVNKAFELATGHVTSTQDNEQLNGKNHTPLSPHLIEAAKPHKDSQELAHVRQQLATLQNGGSPKNDEQSDFNVFFRKYKQEEETYQQKQKRKEEEDKQIKENEELEKRKGEKEEEEKQLQQAGTPQGKQRRNIFSKVKKRASMVETKASSGKQ